MDRAVELDLLVRNVWAIALRAVLASAFGACVLVDRSVPMAALVMAYGMYSVVDGIFALFAALQRRRPNEDPRWAYVVVGSSSLALGLVMLLWTGMTIAVLVHLAAASAIVSGLAQLVGALRLRQQVRGEWFLALGGLVAIAFGIAAVALSVGSTTLAHWVSGYRLVDGAILSALALRLRRWENQALAQVATEDVAEPAIDISLDPAFDVGAKPAVPVRSEPAAEALPARRVASPSAQ
jgi:uncharacterized membrane protein HdeD (DUF308 family)